MAEAADFGVGLMHEVAITAAKVGGEPDDFAKLAKNKELMKAILGVLRGTHEIKAVEYLIDCDADPFVPSGRTLVEHKRGGKIKFDPVKIKFYLSKQQKKGAIGG